MSYKENINENRQRSAEERAANDLHERLEKLVLTGREAAQRRWFWELLQNAMDTAGRDGVQVRVDYTDDNLTFSHNGKVFSSKELSRLTEQDSSKRDELGPDRPIGRFGTGFLTTHLLSRVVRVRGVVHDPGERPKQVDLVLDRTGDNAEELRAGVENAFVTLERLDDSPDVTYYAGDFNTSFRYDLIDGGRAVAEAGLADLRQCLPLTMALNDKIASVELISESAVYRIQERTDIEENASLVRVERATEDGSSLFDFLVLGDKKLITVSVPVRQVDGVMMLDSLPSEYPRLFCAFPLIGSESFPLPVVLNSVFFHPTEARDGVILTDADHYKPQENKQLVQSAGREYWRLLEIARKRAWRRLYVLAGIGTIGSSDWISKDWFEKAVSTRIRKRLLREPLVETEDGQIRPFQSPTTRESYVPSGPDPESRDELYEFAAAIISPGRLPKRSDVEAWHQDGRLWNDAQKLYPEDVVRFVSRCENLNGLRNSLSLDKEATVGWLHDFVRYLKPSGNGKMLNVFRGRNFYVKKEGDIFSEIEPLTLPILPDQYGAFKLLSELWIDDIEDEELKDVLDLLGRDVRSELLDTRIQISEEAHKALTSQDLAKDIEDRIRKRLSSGSRDETAFYDLLRWFDENEHRALELFPALYSDQHLLQTADQARAIRQKAAMAGALENEVQKLKAEVKRLTELSGTGKSTDESDTPQESEGQIRAEQLMEAWSAVKKALGQLGEVEHRMALKDLAKWLRDKPGLFEHVNESAKDAYLAWISKVYRAKAAVRTTLEHNLNYECSSWLDDERFPTIVQGVVYRGLPITMVVRPADGGFIVLYDDEEKAILSLPDAELWIEGGGFEPQRLTLGKLATWLNVNRFPLSVPKGQPAIVHLS